MFLSGINLLFRYKPLDNGLERRLLNNRLLNRKLRLIDVSEPWGQEPDPAKWRQCIKPRTIGLSWGMIKLGSSVFVDFCRENSIPVIFMERSPLMKNGRLALYFDSGGTTNLSSYWGKANWQLISSKRLDASQTERLNAYREDMRGVSEGVDIQKERFMPIDVIKSKLGIPLNKKIIFCPMQVDNDVTITVMDSSPWIRNMAHFLSVIVECLDDLPDDYHIIVKEHPRNVIRGTLTEYPGVTGKITFVREDVNSNALCQGCDAVLSINSGMGTEAMVFHKPVISLGKSFYSGKGLNFEAGDVEQLRGLFRDVEGLKVNKELLDIYIYHMIFDFSYDLETREDTLRFLKMIKKTGDELFGRGAGWFSGTRWSRLWQTG